MPLKSRPNRFSLLSIPQPHSVVVIDPDAIFPSREKATEVTPPWWPSNTHNDLVHKDELDVTLGTRIQLEYNLYIHDSFGLIAIPER
jgi:hypothetical protein